MPNMSYCRFENTLRDLEDCIEALQEMGGYGVEGYMHESSDREAPHVLKLIRVCAEVAENWGEEAEELDERRRAKR